MNTWRFYGNVGSPATETMSHGKKIINFTVAINRGYYNAQGEWVERVQWVRVAKFYPLEADLTRVQSKVKVGSVVMVDGDPTASGYTDREGKPAASLEVMALSFRVIKEAEAK